MTVDDAKQSTGIFRKSIPKCRHLKGIQNDKKKKKNNTAQKQHHLEQIFTITEQSEQEQRETPNPDAHF